MCKFMKSNGELCKNKSKNAFCHMHKDKIIIQKTTKTFNNKFDNLTTLNKILLNKITELKLKNEYLEEEIQNKKSIEMLEIRKLKVENKFLECKIDNLVNQLNEFNLDDYKKYLDIKKFENIKLKLRKHIDVNNSYAIYDFLNNQKNKEYLKYIFEEDCDNYFTKYNSLKYLRNKSAHLS